MAKNILDFCPTHTVASHWTRFNRNYIWCLSHHLKETPPIDTDMSLLFFCKMLIEMQLIGGHTVGVEDDGREKKSNCHHNL